MKLDDFKVLHNKFQSYLEGGKALADGERDQYMDAMYDDNACYEWAIVQDFNSTGFNYKRFCCIRMAEKIFAGLKENGKADLDNKDVVMRLSTDNTFGIPIHDGGNAVVPITFCPWCGVALNSQ